MPTTFFLLFGLMSLGFAAFTYYMFDIFIFSNYRNAKRCTERTEGVIIRYSYALYNGISLPVVEYTVDGNRYKVLGPKFRYAISNTISSPVGSIVSDVKMDNFEDGEIPQVLRYKIYRNSFISLTKSPLMERFPIGGKVTVYYDPKKPKHSYVERPLKPGPYAWLFKFSIYLLVFLMVALAFFTLFILPNLMR
ncbi:DUF3592 domain-containing protein [Streptococcus infantis]|uniref:DUF3592 domain-containing protein n=1 Tax=Streptococcus infantis TaxID=68892 RepID=UPI001BDA8C80|nr:DUF3592 domain-containing protein [Streptococcus infantis]MBT0951167.1 DUF3592 domain-containing protein [Streptococcus infantis]